MQTKTAKISAVVASFACLKGDVNEVVSCRGSPGTTAINADCDIIKGWFQQQHILAQTSLQIQPSKTSKIVSFSYLLLANCIKVNTFHNTGAIKDNTSSLIGEILDLHNPRGAAEHSGEQMDSLV